jgi:hypothetical protein
MANAGRRRPPEPKTALKPKRNLLLIVDVLRMERRFMNNTSAVGESEPHSILIAAAGLRTNAIRHCLLKKWRLDQAANRC